MLLKRYTSDVIFAGTTQLKVFKSVMVGSIDVEWRPLVGLSSQPTISQSSLLSTILWITVRIQLELK